MHPTDPNDPAAQTIAAPNSIRPLLPANGANAGLNPRWPPNPTARALAGPELFWPPRPAYAGTAARNPTGSYNSPLEDFLRSANGTTVAPNSTRLSNSALAAILRPTNRATVGFNPTQSPGLEINSLASDLARRLSMESPDMKTASSSPDQSVKDSADELLEAWRDCEKTIREKLGLPARDPDSDSDSDSSF